MRFSAFQGMFPRASSRLLDPNQAQVARDVKLQSGALRAIREPAFVENVELTGIGVQSIYRWRVGGEEYWFRHPGDVDIVRGPLNEDVWQRVYFTGAPRYDEPRYAYTPVAYDGGSNIPVASYKIGIPAPQSPVTLSAVEPVSGDIDSIHMEFPLRVVTTDPHGIKTGDIVRFDVTAEEPDEGESDLAEFANDPEGHQVTRKSDTEFTLDRVDGTVGDYSDFSSGSWEVIYPEGFRETRFYAHTYVSNLGEEGPPDSAPVSIEVGRRQAVEITLPSIEPAAGQGRIIDKRRIYRTTTGSEGNAEFQFVAELEANDNSFTDDLTGQQLGSLMESAEWDPPPEGLRGLIVLPAGFLAGFDGNRVYFSEPYRPHAWPESYSLALDEEVVALGRFDTSIVAATGGQPYLLTGSDPRAVQPRQLEASQGCVSKRSMVSMGYGCVYASSDGLVMVSGNGAQLITRQYMPPDEWARYHPETIHAYEIDGRYVAFYDGGPGERGGFIFDPREPHIGFTELSFHCVGGHRDPLEPRLYLLKSDGDIVRWDAGEELMPFTYRSPVIQTRFPINLGAAQIIAESYDDLRFSLIADGAVVDTGTVASDEPFVLNAGYLARAFEYEITGTDTVCELAFKESIEELAL
ncbi:MAG: hypothetical protein LAT50_12160 [Ectothiorhodospiraceae bacterium]|nr:hypothetical protein [Ectothiorhodospiraceae bacterium]